MLKVKNQDHEVKRQVHSV